VSEGIAPGAILGVPRDESGPVFKAPWEALAFGLAVKLHERGLFTWKEWADALAREIKAAQAAGDPDLGDTYYLHWARALEKLMIGRGLADEGGIAALAEKLEHEAEHHREAQRATHGRPVSTA
jgi:nitrile hydratase accessory protein